MYIFQTEAEFVKTKVKKIQRTHQFHTEAEIVKTKVTQYEETLHEQLLAK
jgi:hypothetical protein